MSTATMPTTNASAKRARNDDRRDGWAASGLVMSWADAPGEGHASTGSRASILAGGRDASAYLMVPSGITTASHGVVRCATRRDEERRRPGGSARPRWTG